MNKDTKIKFVGQPIFKQILKLVDKCSFSRLVKNHKSDYYYKAFRTWDQFVTMMFGILNRCDSMSEICEGLRGYSGKLNHLGLRQSPAKSTAGDGLRNRDNIIFEELYYDLFKRYQSFLSVSRNDNCTIEKLFIIDSTTIRLFSDILKGVGRNPKNDGKKKGGLKVHMLIDAVQSVGKFLRISEARSHDKNFLKHIDVPSHSMLVFDKAYNHYLQFANWTEKQIYFVTRQKTNAVCTVLETLINEEPSKGVYKEEYVEISYKDKSDNQFKTLKLRRVNYRDKKNRDYVFITNNFEISPEEVAMIYKKRWGIELLFKKMKQNFQLHYFYGENENAIRTQVWCTLIVQLLLTVLQRMSKTKKAFSTIATLVRIHLVSLLDVYDLISNVNRRYFESQKTKTQAELFPS